MTKKQEITIELSTRTIRTIDTLCVLEKTERSKLLERFIERGLRERETRHKPSEEAK